MAELLNTAGATVELLQFGLPDQFIEHGSQAEQLRACGLDPETLRERLEATLREMERPRQDAARIV